jgi:hypothetical protein
MIFATARDSNGKTISGIGDLFGVVLRMKRKHLARLRGLTGWRPYARCRGRMRQTCPRCNIKSLGIGLAPM